MGRVQGAFKEAVFLWSVLVMVYTERLPCLQRGSYISARKETSPTYVSHAVETSPPRCLAFYFVLIFIHRFSENFLGGKTSVSGEMHCIFDIYIM